MSDGDIKTEHVPRQVIENQLLVVLDDKSKVAIVASEEDLEHLVNALRYHTLRSPAAKSRRANLLAGLVALGRAAFDWKVTD